MKPWILLASGREAPSAEMSATKKSAKKCRSKITTRPWRVLRRATHSRYASSASQFASRRLDLKDARARRGTVAGAGLNV